MKKAKGPLVLLNLDKTGPQSPSEPPSSSVPEEVAAGEPPPQAPSFVTLPRRPWMITDLFRALLILLSLVVAAGFVLILLQQPTVDKMARDLQSRRGTSQQEMIAFLYLGEEIKDNEFQVRGVVRNITTVAIEQLDAAIRFYSHDGTVLETAIVRMNKEKIDPDAIAQFELVYPNYRSDFASYAVEFKLRDGDLVPFKDMRGTRTQTN